MILGCFVKFISIWIGIDMFVLEGILYKISGIGDDFVIVVK